MAGLIAPNLVTYGQSAAAVAARNAEYADTPLTDVPGDGTYADPYLGMNRAGSNAPGIGICTGIVFLTAAEVAAEEFRPDNWTELDQGPRVDGEQVPAARIPQTTQTVGGIVDAAPEYEGIRYPSPAEAGVVPVKIADDIAVDYNNTANFVITDTAAVDGAVMDTVSGALNDTGETVGIGDLIWGQVPVV
jgi:hypothetical protein